MKHTVLKLDGIPDVLEKELNDAYTLIDIHDSSFPDNEQLKKEATVGVANGESQLTPELLIQFPALKLIAIFGVGYDGVDMHYINQKNIVVTNTPGVLTDDVADLAVTFSLALMRDVIAANAFVQRGEWATTRYPLTRQFSRKKVGIVGMGRVGQALCRRLAAFSCAVYYIDVNRVEVDATRIETVEQLAVEVDILILCANATAQTRHIIDRDVLAALGPDGYLVNVSRGSLVNQTDLIAALEHGVIAGAALDVLENEPTVPGALVRPNVILTPHYASGTHETREAMGKLVADNIRLFLNEGVVLTAVS